MTWSERIVVAPDILVGKPVIKGTRLAVEFIVDLLAQGWSEREILKNYPGLTLDDIRASLAYASAALHEERVTPWRWSQRRCAFGWQTAPHPSTTVGARLPTSAQDAPLRWLGTNLLTGCAMAAEPPHVIISFDMETDLGNWWTTYEGVTAGTPRLLEILARHRTPATFLFTADAAQAYPRP